jgi:hypothetical protein
VEVGGGPLWSNVMLRRVVIADVLIPLPKSCFGSR